MVPLDRSEACPLKQDRERPCSGRLLSIASSFAHPRRLTSLLRQAPGTASYVLVADDPGDRFFKSARYQFQSHISIISVRLTRLRQRDAAGIAILTARQESQKSRKRAGCRPLKNLGNVYAAGSQKSGKRVRSREIKTLEKCNCSDKTLMLRMWE